MTFHGQAESWLIIIESIGGNHVASVLPFWIMMMTDDVIMFDIFTVNLVIDIISIRSVYLYTHVCYAIIFI